MPRKASGEIKTHTVKVKQKNGDVYVYERQILYNPEKRYNETLESHLNREDFRWDRADCPDKAEEERGHDATVRGHSKAGTNRDDGYPCTCR